MSASVCTCGLLKTSSDIQVPLPCSVARYGVAVLAYTDFDLRVDAVRVPLVEAALVDCARICLRV